LVDRFRQKIIDRGVRALFNLR